MLVSRTHLFVNVKKHMHCAPLLVKPLIVSCVSSSTVPTSPLHEASASSPGIPKVVLKKGKAQLFRNGSPMVYSGAIDRIIGRPPPKTGDIVLVTDGSEKPIGWGLYNSFSMFSVRIMQLEDEVSRHPYCLFDMEKLLETRLGAAIKLRSVLGLPDEDTNAFRLVNSEGDRLSGLVVDIFNDLAVIAPSAAWVANYKSSIDIAIGKFHQINRTFWKPSIDIMKQDGLNVEVNNDESCTTHDRIKVMENNIYYSISLDGQKTGFYADQRENRSFISRISKNKKVLDLCCYSGGFSLNAAFGGATSVIGIDSSSAAIELAKENALLNGFDPERVSFFKEDVSNYMRSAASRNELWDLVILDPPKLAPSRKVLQRASGMYRNLNALAMKVIKEGGLLMTCSCSGAIAQSGSFLEILKGAASSAGRRITVLRQAGAASDHPLDPSYLEGSYLTNYLLRVPWEVLFSVSFVQSSAKRQTKPPRVNES